MNFYEMKYQENNIGFSIIELLVVIALIAILTLVGYPNFAEYNKKKQKNSSSISRFLLD